MNAPEPIPGHFVLWARELDLEVALPNAERPQVTQERAGGFRVVPVPQLRPLLNWDGHPNPGIALVGRLDGTAAGRSIQPVVNDLRRLGSKVSTDIRRPPLVRPIGRIPNPTQGTNADWVVTDLKIVEIDHEVGTGELRVASCTIELGQWTQSEIVEQQANANRPVTRTYTWRSNDTLSIVAARELGSASKAQLIRDANPGLHFTFLIKGSQIKIPGAAKK